jgi:hypothetical protein
MIYQKLIALLITALIITSCNKEDDNYDVLKLTIDGRVLSQNRSTCSKVIRPDNISYSIMSWSLYSSEGCKFDEFPDIRNHGYELSYLDAPFHYWIVEPGSSTGNYYSAIDGTMTIGTINDDYVECSFEYTLLNEDGKSYQACSHSSHSPYGFTTANGCTNGVPY